MIRSTAAFLALAACTPYQAPGGGVPKGCVDVAVFSEPLVRGLGLSSHIEHGADATSTAYRVFETGAWGDLGVAVVRTDLTWSRLEPEHGVFDFEGTDRVLAATDAAGADLLAILDYGNPWARADGLEAAPPDDLADFAAYSSAVATRYRGQIPAYEVWNEPNAGYVFWQPTEDPARYGALLAAASAAVRAADEEAKVVFGGVFTPVLLNAGGEDFIRGVHRAIGPIGPHVDAVAFHPYRYPFTAPEHRDERQPSLIDTTCGMWDLLEEVEAVGAALWITELGWHTAPRALAAGISEEAQADWLVRSAMLSFAQGVQRWVWYTFRDSGTDPEDQEQMFGLYGHDADPTDAIGARPKAAVRAWQVLHDALGGHTTVADVSEALGLDEATYGYELSGGRGATTVLWTVGDPLDVLVPGREPARLRGLDGETRVVEPEGGALTVPVTASPVFVVR